MMANTATVSMPRDQKIFYVALSICFMAYVSYALKRRLRMAKVMHQNGCQPAPVINQRRIFFGIDMMYNSWLALRRNRFNENILEQLEKHGSTFQIQAFSRKTTYTIDPQNIRAVYSTCFSDWGVQPIRLPAFEPFVGAGIITTDSTAWERSRALIKPALSRAQITDLSRLQKLVDRLISLIPVDGTTVDLQPLFARLGLDSSTDFLFGQSVCALDPEKSDLDHNEFLTALNLGQASIGKRLKHPLMSWIFPDSGLENACRCAKAVVEKYVTEIMHRKNSGNKEGETTGGRIILANELAKEVEDPAVIRNELLNVFMPAHDASAIALTNIFFHLARHPTVWDKLREDIEHHSNMLESATSNELTLEKLKSMKYLQNVLNETNRVNPSVGSVTRVALRDTVLPTGGGASGDSPIFVPKGDLLTVSLYALHRRKDIYGDDAAIFRPDRWDTLKPPFWSYIPFGGGPRICPGQQLGIAEVLYTVVRLLECFKRIENRDPVFEFIENWKLSTESKNGARVALFQ